MSRYIDADKLFLHFNDWALAVSPDERDSDVPEYSEHKIHEMIYRTINEAMSAIEQQPTADVVPMDFHDKVLEIEIKKQENLVEVVRCKDCVNWQTEWDTSYDGYHYCGMIDIVIDGDFYCKDGERKILPKP